VSEQSAAGIQQSESPSTPFWVGLWPLLLVPLVVGLDQLSKWIIRASVDRGDVWPGDWLVHIVHVTNNGAAFGMLQNSGPLLLITGLLGVGGITIYFLNLGAGEPLLRVGLALMLGGALGNLVDRVANGRVVDFIKFPNFPAFNVADSAITIGVVVLVWAMTFRNHESTDKR
jgi:signal peptidase II